MNIAYTYIEPITMYYRHKNQSLTLKLALKKNCIVKDGRENNET